jgi:ribosome-binding protein aMBF1 (putative translation factor)
MKTNKVTPNNIVEHRQLQRVNLEQLVAERSDASVAFRKSYHAAEKHFEVAHKVMAARKKSGLTRKQLAQRVARVEADLRGLERPTSDFTPSLDLLMRVAAAMNYEVVIQLKKLKRGSAPTMDIAGEF